MAQDLGLGYDLFDAIMNAREKQAKNMAEVLESYNLPVVIVGKAYKPCVEYLDGSASMLVGSFVTKQPLYYLDPLTDDRLPENLVGKPATFLLAHAIEVTYSDAPHVLNQDAPDYHLVVPPGSVIVDPWRRQGPLPGVTVRRYGDTRGRV
jgi:UDPglucose 6-dehydrogenase